MDVSVVIPLLNESESLNILCDDIVDVLAKRGFEYEIIFVDDGSTDSSWDVIKSLSLRNENIKGIRFSKNFGKSQAIHAGFDMVIGKIVVTMDADLQDDPKEIPFMVDMILEEGYDLVSGWKYIRHDSFIKKNLPSKIFNWAARKTSGIELHDFNCGLKAYKKEVVKSIDVSGEMHRYVPILAKNKGFKNIGEKQVRHYPRKFGKTKFGNGRFVKGFLDLITIWFLSRFGKTPMHLFGTLGLLMFFIGFCFILYLGMDKMYIHTSSRPLTMRVEFYAALFTMCVGIQFFLAGFLGELILSIRPPQKGYIISETTQTTLSTSKKNR